MDSKVIMVGDGVNDVFVFVVVDIGVVMGVCGVVVLLEVVDIVLLVDCLDWFVDVVCIVYCICCVVL